MHNVPSIAKIPSNKPQCRACGVRRALIPLSRGKSHLALRACGVATAGQVRACGLSAQIRLERG
eukprot:6330458-Amphidinium_carterae.1